MRLGFESSLAGSICCFPRTTLSFAHPSPAGPVYDGGICEQGKPGRSRRRDSCEPPGSLANLQQRAGPNTKKKRGTVKIRTPLVDQLSPLPERFASGKLQSLILMETTRPSPFATVAPEDSDKLRQPTPFELPVSVRLQHLEGKGGWGNWGYLQKLGGGVFMPGPANLYCASGPNRLAPHLERKGPFQQSCRQDSRLCIALAPCYKGFLLRWVSGFCSRSSAPEGFGSISGNKC